MTHTGEKEAAVLGKLASTLEKLIEIDDAAAGKPKPAQGRKMRDLRDQLAQLSPFLMPRVPLWSEPASTHSMEATPG